MTGENEMNSGETIIGLTNARIKFPDVTNLVYYLMNSDEDFDEAEFAFDWSEVEQEDLDDPNFDPYVDAVDLIRPSWDTWGPDPRYPDVIPHTFDAISQSQTLLRSWLYYALQSRLYYARRLRERIEDQDNDPQNRVLAQEDLRYLENQYPDVMNQYPPGD
jgi:hypothetical protein